METVALLLNRGANRDASEKEYGQTPLTSSAMMGHTEVEMLLLDRGANIDKADRQGKTPLMWAAQYGRVESVELLIRWGAKPDARDRNGRTAFWWTKWNHNKETREKTREILRNAESKKEERRS